MRMRFEYIFWKSSRSMGSVNGSQSKKEDRQVTEPDTTAWTWQINHLGLHHCLRPGRDLVFGSHVLKLFLDEKWEANDIDVAMAVTSKDDFRKQAETFAKCMNVMYKPSDMTFDIPEHDGFGAARLQSNRPHGSIYHLVGMDDAIGTRTRVIETAHPPSNMVMEPMLHDGTLSRWNFIIPSSSLHALRTRHVRKKDMQGLELREGLKLKWDTRGFTFDPTIQERATTKSVGDMRELNAFLGYPPHHYMRYPPNPPRMDDERPA